MKRLMRCPFCGLLQDEPAGRKECNRCGGGLEFESGGVPGGVPSYIEVQLELDQVVAPAGANGERHLLLTIRTPEKVPPEEATADGRERPPVNFTAVMDVSGSMQGEKIQQVKEALIRAVKFLKEGDIFSLVTFSNRANVIFDPLEVDRGSREEILSRVQKVTAGGMTALWHGLEEGIVNASRKPRTNNLLLLLSDGQANVGETDLEKIGELAFKARDSKLITSTIGVGNDYNEALMTEIATQGGGRFYHIQESRQIPAFVAGELGEVATLAAREVIVHLNLPQGTTLLPFSAMYPVRQNDDEALLTVGDIPCDTELEVPMRVAFLAQKQDSRLSISGSLEFKSPAEHAISIPINRVTLRFTDQATFQLREGVVRPVAERVFAQMKATGVLGVSRVRARRPAEAAEHTNRIFSSLREYANLLGEDIADEEMNMVQQQFHALGTSPGAAKRVVSDAASFIRSAKDFNH